MRPGSTNALQLDVHPPIKTDRRYEFRVDVRGDRLSRRVMADRLYATVRGYGAPWRSTLRFGFTAVNYRIAHAEVWDSIFPLMFLTRNHGPLYKRATDAATIRFRYPILEPVRRFFVDRARQLGLNVEVEGHTFVRRYDVPGSGHIVSFGGGKESRLMVGLLRELGRPVRLACGGRRDQPPDLMVEESGLIAGVTNERVFPGLMAGAAHYHYGGTLDTAHLTHPWHQYYDRASPEGQRQLTDLFRSLGLNLTLHAPVSVLPSNLIQKILAARYPELARHQRSVTPGSPSEKNLSVSLYKLYHELPFDSHCSAGLFVRLVEDFVTRQLREPESFGYHRHRELHRRQMRAILWRRRDHPLLRSVRSRIPAAWDARWIDHVHRYVNPDVDPALLDIYREYATDYVPNADEFVVPTPYDRRQQSSSGIGPTPDGSEVGDRPLEDPA